MQAPPTRASVIETAEQFASFAWTPTHSNVRHERGSDGLRVDTPDSSMVPSGFDVGVVNRGIPYCIRGMDTPAQFATKIAAGFAAGNIPLQGAELAVSGNTAGVDCSGFVCRCWGLETHYLTVELAQLSRSLTSYDELKPGDILNRTAQKSEHVLLFHEFADAEHTRVRYYEAGAWRVKRGEMSVDELDAQGYVPQRDPRRTD